MTLDASPQMNDEPEIFRHPFFIPVVLALQVIPFRLRTFSHLQSTLKNLFSDDKISKELPEVLKTLRTHRYALTSQAPYGNQLLYWPLPETVAACFRLSTPGEISKMLGLLRDPDDEDYEIVLRSLEADLPYRKSSSANGVFLHLLDQYRCGREEAVKKAVQRFSLLDSADQVDVQLAIPWLAADDEHWLPLGKALSFSLLSYCEDQAAKNFHQSGQRYFPRRVAQALVRITEDCPELAEEVRDRFIFHYDFLAHGDPEGCLSRLSGNTPWKLPLQAIASMERNETPKTAVTLLGKFLRQRRGGNARLFDEAIYNWYYAVALYRDRANPASLNKIQKILSMRQVQDCLEDRGFLAVLLSVAAEERLPYAVNEQKRLCDYREPTAFWEPTFFYSLATTHFGLTDAVPNSAEAWLAQLKNDYGVLKLDVAQALNQTETVERLTKEFRMHPLLPKDKPLTEWELRLKRLTRYVDEMDGKESGETPQGERKSICYYWSDYSRSFSLRQGRTVGGKTSPTAQTIALSRFAKGMDIMDERDRRLKTLMEHRWGSVWVLDPLPALAELIGSSRLFDSDNFGTPLKVEKVPLRITVTTTETGYLLEANYPEMPLDSKKYLYGGLADGVVTLYEPTQRERELLKLMGGREMEFPIEARASLATFLERLSPHTPVLSDLLKDSTVLRKRKGDAAVTFRFVPAGANFRVTALVRPLADATLVCVPGEGLESIAATVDGETQQVIRNTALERENFAALEAVLSPLDDARESRTTWSTDLPRTLQFLDLLREETEKAHIEWPEGGKIVVQRRPFSFSDTSLTVQSIGHWFEVSGGVRLDDGMTMPISELLKRLRNVQGNFLRLSDTEYVALTEDFRKALQHFEGAATIDRHGNVRVSVFHSDLLDEAEESGVALSADEGFRRRIAKIREAEALVPTVPAGLKAELRDYQTEGFEWLMRLSSWGAGALLADDMGLGKTVQTIALLLARADQGPALVVMPSSVLYNWADELARFAPDLRVTLLNKAVDRAQAVVSAGTGDVILVTYGVMTAEIDTITKSTWSTVVLDEAHSIKNRETKTSKAVMRLASDARVLLTGTPLQNNLSELWNLFEFANPGLLGRYDDFVENFLSPIEKHRDRERQRLLKRLISPFLLRRTKADVLYELPEKTEITLRVTLSDEERALYETIRSRAAMEVEEGSLTAFEALAVLMKLRLAACHPKLVDESLPFASSKSEAFLNLVRDLTSNHHRALVFSQFTSHLALIRKVLDEEGIGYLYLDGSTGPKERKTLVEAFQSGKAPLFLISLKAGGTGLNLTEADYVIHLDPWWNPSVEDQASDRAYRIGQKNSVTIYRLLAEDTIEEKILTLHATKKSLADALLGGTDVSSRLTRDEILSFLTGR